MIRKFNLPALAADENLSKKSPCSLNINDKFAANCKAIPVFASSIDLLDNHNKQNTKFTLHLDDREAKSDTFVTLDRWLRGWF